MDTAYAPLLVETIARHFPDARIDGNTVVTGLADLKIECDVGDVSALGAFQSVSLYFRLRGGRLGGTPLFASISGYAPSPEAAITMGACNWACTLGPLVRAALLDEDEPEVDRADVTIHGRRFRMFVDGIDRALFVDDGPHDVAAQTRTARYRLGGSSWLANVVIDAEVLPAVTAPTASLLSVFVGDFCGQRIAEVKVNGRDWVRATAVFDDAPSAPRREMTLLRELAILVPLEPPPPLTRTAVETTLAGLDADWPGWRHHGGRLDRPLTTAEVEALEQRIGPLPADYRAFLVDVASTGAGPGYGLLSPLGEVQRALATGRFTWDDGASDPADTAGVLVLAHAGCGIMWLLVAEGPHRGEVWIDARPSGGGVRPVADSFSEWYASWLDAEVRDHAPWTQWDANACATAGVLAQVVESVSEHAALSRPLAGRTKPGSLALFSAATPYFDLNAPLDPCHPCAALAAHLGVDATAFVPGVAPRPGADAPRRGGLGSWIRGLFRS